MPDIIEVNHLVKQYPAVKAVDDISFSVRQGECFGMLGPNGAGKTTTVEIMEGITPASHGTVHYQGETMGPRFRSEVGIQFQSTALQDFLTVRETLRLFRSFYPRGLPLEELAKLCALEDYMDRDARKLSGGQRQRLLLALALVNDPVLLFLDEPTTGLDPQARHNFWELVRMVKARGKTVILTTHYMEEAYLLCDRIIIMDHGRIIAEGRPATLMSHHFRDAVLQLPQEDFRPAQHSMTENIKPVGEYVEIITSDINATIAALLHHGVSLAHLQIRARTLEDLFLELTGRELRA